MNDWDAPIYDAYFEGNNDDYECVGCDTNLVSPFDRHAPYCEECHETTYKYSRGCLCEPCRVARVAVV